MKENETIFEMLSTLSHFFDEYVDRVQSLVEEQDVSEYKKNPSEAILRIMKNALAGLEKDLVNITNDLNNKQSIDIQDLLEVIENINKGGDDGEGGLH